MTQPSMLLGSSCKRRVSAVAMVVSFSGVMSSGLSKPCEIAKGSSAAGWPNKLYITKLLVGMSTTKLNSNTQGLANDVTRRLMRWLNGY